MRKSLALVSAVSLSTLLSLSPSLSSAFSPLSPWHVTVGTSGGTGNPPARRSSRSSTFTATATRGRSSASSSSSSSQLRYIVTSQEPLQGHRSSSSSSSTSSLDHVLDMNISEDSIRKHYQEWCSKFHRRQDSFRFIVFQRNYLSQFKWNLAAGKQAFTLNEYADCTEEEYKLLMERAAEAAKYVTHPVPVEEEALEVTVVFDENDFPVEFQTPNNYIDVEVVEKESAGAYWLPYE